MALVAMPAAADDILGVQKSLAARGYSVGRVDGLIGPQTRQAIRAFQSDHGLPSDGEVSETLMQLLAQPRPLAPIVIVPPVVNPQPEHQPDLSPDKAQSQKPETPESFAGKNWLIHDQGPLGQPMGQAFSLFLEEGGRIAGPDFANHMRWQSDGPAAITISYENIVGLSVKRVGHLSSKNRISGQAEASDGAKWTWTAVARPDPSANQPGGSKTAQ